MYKKRPARVVKLGEKLEIELDNGDIARVRPKDVEPLHPGPVENLKDTLRAASGLTGTPELAWELLGESDAPFTLAQLADLAFDRYTPASALAAWQWVEDGLMFRGTPGAIIACSAEDVRRETAARQVRQAEAQAWHGFIDRAEMGRVDPQQDARFLREVEDLALGRRSDSRVLRELGRNERPEAAHALLLAWGAWDTLVNPYPARQGVLTYTPQMELPELPDEPRLDLTGLAAFAIDDKLNQDPDDAISLEAIETDMAGNLVSARLWVHVADAAALVPPGSPADEEARRRGATLYLPEGAVPMLPAGAVTALGLGLQEVSPALSFHIEINAQGEPQQVTIHPTWVRVQRLSYEDAELRLDEPVFHGLELAARAFYNRRQRSGAFLLDLPEVMVKVIDGRVQIDPLLRLRSRDMVRELMLLAGESVARFAIEQRLPFPFASQEAMVIPAKADPLLALWRTLPTSELNLSQRFALRRLLKRSQVTTIPTPHAGVGLQAYSRLTSPLRRYLDLAAHQQLRRFLRGETPLNEGEMIERVGYSEAVTGTIARTEMLSRRHWTLVYLMQQPEWRGEAVLVEKNGGRGYALLPELAYETPVSLRHDLPLDSRLTLSVRAIYLAELEAQFNILEG